MYIITETSKATGYVWYVSLSVTARVFSQTGVIVNNYAYSVTDEIEDATTFCSRLDVECILKQLDKDGYTDSTRNTYEIVEI